MKNIPNEDVPVDILIWGDSIALIAISEPVFGTVLTHHNIAQLFRIIFNVAWQQL